MQGTVADPHEENLVGPHWLLAIALQESGKEN